MKELTLSLWMALAGLAPAGLGADAVAASEGAASAKSPAAVPAAAALALIEGPASVSLGAEAMLDLPDGWKWVPKAQLPAYFAASKRAVGAWDLGVALVGEPAAELRLQFEPLGAVAEAALPPVEEFLLTAQAAAAAEGRRRLQVGLQPRELRAWRWEPNYQAETRVLRFGGVWQQQEQEALSMHLRWLGRRGVVKLDWKGDEEDANAFSAMSEQLDEALHFVPGAALSERQPGDPAAKLGLDTLVLDGLFGRGALAGGKQTEPIPLAAWIAAALAAALVAAWLGLKAWRGLDGWLKARSKAKEDEKRLGYYEKKLGARAGEVELEEEEKQEGY